MNTAQRSFSSGEFSPDLYARTDVAKYQVGLKTCRNFIVQKSGGACNRPGTEFLSPLGSRARVIRFVFSASQTYLLVFTDGLLMIVQDGGVVSHVASPYASTDAFQFAQSGDVVTIVHPNHVPRELRRVSHTVWAFSTISTGPLLVPPTNLAIDGPDIATPTHLPNSPFSTPLYQWAVTAVTLSGSESQVSNVVMVHPAAAVGPRTLTWNAVTGADHYNIYKDVGNGLSYLGTSTTLKFYDTEIVPDALHVPPVARVLFTAPDTYPSAVTLYQQRRVFAGSNLEPETVWTSRTGDYADFGVSTPIQDDDAITFTLAGTQVTGVRHLVDAGTLVIFTESTELIASGDSSGVLRPTDINIVPLSRHGSSAVPPIVMDDQVLYVQARQSIVRSLALSNTYRQQATGSDLTVYSSHLFESGTVVEWAYQEVPHSVLWVVKSDGTLLGLTYLPEQDVIAWHRHDTLGTIENVCVVPEGTEDAVYLVVLRNGVRCLERMGSRRSQSIFTDASLSYDGTGTGTMTIESGSEWTFDELLRLTSSTGAFLSTDPGNRILLQGETDLYFTIDTVTSPTNATGHVQKTVPASMRNVAIGAWVRAVDELQGLDHLEGQRVTVMAGSTIVANPNDTQITYVATVRGGAITLPVPYPQITVGLPYLSDLQTLDIDSASGPSLKEKAILINGVTVYAKESTGGYVGQEFPTGSDPLQGMNELQMREITDDLEPFPARTRAIELGIDAGWTKTGSVAIRHVDPTPLTVLAITARGTFPTTR